MRLATANRSSTTSSTRQTAATADESITVSGSEQQSQRTTMVRGAVAATVVGLALGGGLVLLIGLLRGPRPRVVKSGRTKKAA